MPMRWCSGRRSISDRWRCNMRTDSLPAYARCSADSAVRAAPAPICCRICCSTAISAGRCFGWDTRTRLLDTMRLRRFLTCVARTSSPSGGRNSGERTLRSRTIRRPMLTRTAPRERHLSGLSPHGFHRVVYYEWGASENGNVIVCVHGVGRNARDFDVLAEALSPTHRVLAVDMPGRGNSDWLADPNDYVFPVYLSTLTALVARSGAETVSWVGTSMGGLLGIVLAAQPRSPVARLVVNDVGPVIEPAALARIADYFGKDPTFASFAEIERYLREIAARGPRPRVLEIEGVGHAPMFLTPDQVDPVVAFLRESMLS